MDALRVSRAETQTVKETLAERDERIRRLERLADEYRSLRAQLDLLQTRVMYIIKKKRKSHTEIFYACPRPPTPIFGSSGRVPDVVTHPKFLGDWFRGFAPRGRQKSHFSYI